MKMYTVQFKGKFDNLQMREIMEFLENQETTDRELDTFIGLSGEYGYYDIAVDEDNNIVIELN